MPNDQNPLPEGNSGNTAKPRTMEGKFVVLGLLAVSVTVILLGLILSATARFGAEVEILNDRVKRLEEKTGLPVGDLPRREQR